MAKKVSVRRILKATSRGLCWLVLASVIIWLTAVVAQQFAVEPPPTPTTKRWEVPDIGSLGGFTSDGFRLFSIKNENGAAHLILWDLRTGKRVRTHKLPFAKYGGGRSEDLAANRLFISSQGDQQWIIDLKTGEEWNTRREPDNSSRIIASSPDGKYLWQTSGFARSALVEARTGKVLHRTKEKEPSDGATVLGMVDGVKFAPNGKYVFFFGQESAGTPLHMFDLSAGKVALTIRDSYMWRRPVLSPGGRHLVVPSIAPAKTRQEFLDRQIVKGHPGQVTIIGMNDLKVQAAIPWSDLDRLQYQLSGDGRLAAFWHDRIPEEETPGVVQFWDIAVGKLLWSTEVGPSPRKGEFSPDGKHYAMYSHDGQRLSLHMLDIEGQRRRWKMESIDDRIPPFFTSDSKYLVHPVLDSVKHFDVASGRAHKSLHTDRWAGTIRATSDGRYLLFEDFVKPPANAPNAAGAKQWVRTWRVMHRDSGREVYRSDYPGYHRIHVPGDGSTLIQIVIRKGGEEFDMSCWDLPK